jgi:hypothetical protein
MWAVTSHINQSVEDTGWKRWVNCNASGSQVVRGNLKEDLMWNKKKGFHWYTGMEKEVPVFFTSMLSGQRALDRRSYERLVWHIKRAVK